MRLTKVRVQNFRGLRDVECPLSDFVCIIGENNVGKSSLLLALQLFAEGSKIPIESYYDSQEEISISVTFSDVLESDLELISDIHRPKIEPLLEDRSLTLVRRYDKEGRSKLRVIKKVTKDPKYHDSSVTEALKGKNKKDIVELLQDKYPEIIEAESEICWEI